MKNFGRQTILLLAGDWITLGLFVFIGQMEHGLVAANPLPRLLSASAEIVLPWTVVALLWGALTLSRGMTLRTFMWRALTAWLVGAPLALLVRAWLNGQATIIVIFMAITIGLGGLFLLVWRMIFFWLRQRFATGSE